MSTTRHFVLTIGLIVGIAIAAGVVSFRLAGDAEVRSALAQRDALAWLRTEFDLTDAQFAKIQTLHASYSVECEEHCRAIQEAMRARKTLRDAAGTPAEALAAADQRVQELRQICETAIAAHVRRCAAEMSPDAGARYLALVLPKIADFDHQAAPDLGLNGHAHRH